MKTIIGVFLIGLLLVCFYSCNKQEITEKKSDSRKVDNVETNSDKIKTSVNLYNYKVYMYEDTTKENKTTYRNIYIEIEDTVSKKITFRKNCFEKYSDRDSTLWRVDLDNDGQYELIVFGIAELTSYVSEQCLIIDFKKKPEPILSVNNPEFIKENGEYLIKVNVRESPSALVHGYSYCLSYINGELKYKYVKDLTKGYCLCDIGEDPENCLKSLSEKREICQNEAAYGCFKMFILNKTLSNEESGGWLLFDKLYTCKDKIKIKKELKEDVNSIIDDIMKGDYNYTNDE